jgi:hypothetical protein
VRRVLAERERRAIDAALATVDAALREVKGALSDVDPAVKAQARFRIRRLEQLAALCRVGQGLLKMLLDSARVDVGPLKALSDALTGRGRG